MSLDGVIEDPGGNEVAMLKNRYDVLLLIYRTASSKTGHPDVR